MTKDEAILLGYEDGYGAGISETDNPIAQVPYGADYDAYLDGWYNGLNDAAVELLHENEED